MEHVTTANGVAFVEGGGERRGDDHRAAPDARPQRMLVGGIRPHYYCLPVLKRARHRRRSGGRRPAATRGSFSAPTARRTRRATKEAACGCAGVFSAPVALGLPRAGLRRGGRARPARGLREPLRPGVLPAAAERGADHARAAGRAGGAAGARSRPGPGRSWCSTRASRYWRVGTERSDVRKRLSFRRGDGAADGADAARDPRRALPRATSPTSSPPASPRRSTSTAAS